MSKKADLSLADSGERLLTSWRAVSNWVVEHQAVTQLPQAIRVSPYQLHTVDSLSSGPEREAPAAPVAAAPAAAAAADVAHVLQPVPFGLASLALTLFATSSPWLSTSCSRRRCRPIFPSLLWLSP